MWIAFEGHDGSGKTTTAEAVVMELAKQGKDVMFVRTPGTTPYGKYIRANWHKNENVRMLQFIANHVEVIEEVVKPHIAKGGWVVQDRLYISSVVYSGWAGDLDTDFIARTARMWIGDKPDITFIFECDTKTALERLAKQDKDLPDPDEVLFETIKMGYKVEGRVIGAKFVNTDRPQEQVIADCLESIRYL